MPSTALQDRIATDGKFFRLAGRKFYCKGVTYGPFAANASGDHFASPEQTARDLEQIKALHANVVRVYYVPPRWFMDLAHEHGLKVLVDVPWAKHLCFLDSRESQRQGRAAVKRAAAECGGHPALFALSVVNEIAPDIVRWGGTRRVETFIDELVAEAKSVHSECLCTFASFPPTEYLMPQDTDFVCFNVYLHDQRALKGYLARLQTLADSRPLMLGEFGMDSIRNGAEHQAEFLTWQVETAFRAGAAGTMVFSFTDDWVRGGMQIEDWAFGVTTRSRAPKPSFAALQRQYEVAPHFPLPKVPKVSVVVATYNGGRTLKTCLESLQKLNYPDYEVIVIDDGSRDKTPEIARSFDYVRYIRQPNSGLSAARNSGILAASGEIVAFTDDDCRADEDWLYYLVSDMVRGGFDGIGGHNFLPPDDSPVAAAVMASPGGPAHVLLSDAQAEHVPGCNMAFNKAALLHIGMFDPVFRKAGDDVDVCWRMQDAGFKLGFSPSGFVWHYRRSTVKAYLKQQSGYGEAEGMLIRKHPEHFNSFGGGIWRGRIYSSFNPGLLIRGPVIYRGVFGTGFFQRLYTPDPVTPLLLFSGLGYHLCVNLPLAILTFYFPVLLPAALLSFILSISVSVLAGVQAALPSRKTRFWSRPLITLLFFLQPIVRGWARIKHTLSTQATGRRTGRLPASSVAEVVTYWSPGNVDRVQFLQNVAKRLRESGWNMRTDSGWTDYDLDIPAQLFARLQLSTAGETLELGRYNIRRRIKGFWSLPAKILFVLTVLCVLVLIDVLSDSNPWIWLSLTALPLLGWWLSDNVDSQAALLSTELDTVAQELELVRLDNDAPSVSIETAA